MGVFDRQIKSALRLITKYGKTVQLVRFVDVDGPNPWDPKDSVEELHEAKAVFLNYSSDTIASMSKVAGSEIHMGDRKVLIAASSVDVEPNMKDLIRDVDGDWSVVNVEELSPNGEKIIYTLQARQ